MIIFTDRVLEKLDAFIGQYEPERGGALLALPESNVVVEFMPDPGGEMTRSSYVPSSELTPRVQQAEREHGLAFCGVVHSHPGSFNEPSGQDDVAFRKGLDINSHIARFIAPIITIDGPAESNSRFQKTIGNAARMTCYVAYRSKEAESFWPKNRNADRIEEIGDPLATKDCGEDRLVRDVAGRVRLLRTAIDVMPIKAQVEALRARLERKLGRMVRARAGPVIELGGVSCLTESLTFDGGDLMVIVPPTFPFTAPIVVEGHGTDAHEVKFDWEMDFATRPESLADALIDHLGGSNNGD